MKGSAKRVGKKSLGKVARNERIIEEWKSGRLRMKASVHEVDGTIGATWEESGPEYLERRKRLEQFKSIRSNLDLSQSEMAAALHVATKTLQGWEIGKPIPDPVFILAELMRDLPAVRKRLLAA